MPNHRTDGLGSTAGERRWAVADTVATGVLLALGAAPITLAAFATTDACLRGERPAP
jgi:type IV secretory pathway VirB2 component (pilin)